MQCGRAILFSKLSGLAAQIAMIPGSQKVFAPVSVKQAQRGCVIRLPASENARAAQPVKPFRPSAENGKILALLRRSGRTGQRHRRS